MSETKMAATSAKAKKSIVMPSLKLERARLRLIGLTPLIVNNFAEKAKTEIAERQQGKATMKKAARDPEAEYEAARILDSQGRDCIKASYLKMCCLSSFRFSDDFKRTELTGAFFVEGNLIPLDFEERSMRTDPVRISGGTTTLRYRPMYTGWSVGLSVVYQSNFISTEQLLNMFRTSGFAVGLCEWRPEKNGDMGRFKIDAASVEVSEVPDV